MKLLSFTVHHVGFCHGRTVGASGSFIGLLGYAVAGYGTDHQSGSKKLFNIHW